MSSFYAALEVGTTRTVLAIGEADSTGRVRVTCHAEIPSTGIRKSQIHDIKQATQSIRSVLSEISKKQDEIGNTTTVGNAYLVINGPHVSTISSPGMTQISGKIVADDLSSVFDHARSMPIPEGREILDIIEQDYAVDDSGGVVNPRGMSGHLLKLNTLKVIADKNHIQDARTASSAANLDISEPVFAATCAAEAVLNETEKKDGVLVLDLGGGSTGYAVYADGYIHAAGVIGVGGDHVTNDVAHAFQASNAQAEELKLNEACAVLRGDSESTMRIRVPGSSALMESRTISRRSLNTVVNARVKELFVIVRETLEERGLLSRMHAGVVLTGGGARLKAIAELAEQTLGLRVRIGSPTHVTGFEDEDFPPAYASIAGALLYAYASDDKRSSIFDGFKRWFK